MKSKQTLVNEINLITEDNKNLFDKKQAIEVDTKELKETIETLRNEIGNLEIEVLSMQTKLSQATFERQRLE